ncbi:MAG: flagellar biosynthesis protein FlhF [Pseudomonadales bacterium]
MTIRTIVANTMQQAMQQAKQEMGDDAIILASRRVDDHFEVTVTDDANCLTSEEEKIPTASVSPGEINTAPLQPTPVKAEPRLSTNEPALQKLLGDLRSIGDHWENMGGEANKSIAQPVNPVREELKQRLACLHLEEHVSDELLQQFRDIPDVDRAWHLAIAQLQTRLAATKVDVIADGGAYVFVGPSGAGKTASIAKLAAEYVLLHGAHNIALITTDAFRIGASEQLLKLGDILGIEVQVVEGQSEGLAAALAGFSTKRTILIDSAGLGGNDADLTAQLADIRRQGERINSLLVLPVNIQYACMQAAYENYLVQPYTGCVFTRLDECDSLGAAVSLALQTELPLAYIASGHAIPDDLSRVNSAGLVEHLLSIADRENNTQNNYKAQHAALPTPFAQQLQLAF